jgi:RNA recognition motif-containing protein
METQPTAAKIVCRKCGGPHLTIKCGKEKAPVPKLETPTENINTNTKRNHNSDHNRDHNRDHNNQHRFKKTYRVKITELPADISEEELMELLFEWGNIVKVRVNNYEDNSIAYVDFGHEEEADYFIKALDKTPFESIIISVQKVANIKRD